MSNYNPYDWYWLADDARLFSSKQQLLIDDTDSGYVTWTDLGNVPTPWPRDDAGNQTDASLQEVVGPNGVFVNLVYYAADARFRHATGGVIVSSISAIAFLTDVVARNTLANANEHAKNTPGTVAWKFADGSFMNLDGAQLTTATNAVATFVQNCFSCESTTVDGIDGGTITTRQQVDDAFAAISNVFP
jgi:hypothetical protein